tara:strand:+ start:4344 stop:4802 length:459 start_codon:yes stop_codon:yes gene_type:complete
MSTSTFKKAYSKRVKFKQTEIEKSWEYGRWNFTVKGSVKDAAHFKEMFILERSKMHYNESAFVNGVYDENKDIAYLNLLEVLESGDYQMKEFDYDYIHRVPAELKCCDEWLSLGSFTNTCPHCGADYNGSGSLLASRSQWGEETGEHWSECY